MLRLRTCVVDNFLLAMEFLSIVLRNVDENEKLYKLSFVYFTYNSNKIIYTI